jgi:cytochrome c oxidase assembly factor CtaG
MSTRALALDWRVDGTLGLGFALLLAAAGVGYVRAARLGTARDRRHRPWPHGRTLCFLSGLTVLFVDLYSGIGAEADTRLSVHMLEHTLIWVVATPLLVAGAPLRLAFFVLASPGRRRLARCLRSRPVSALTTPAVAVSLFGALIVLTHLPAVYGLTLTNDYVHEAEHGLYLIAAMLVWAPLLGVDPIPNRPGPRAQLVCVLACMVPMGAVAIWLGTSSVAVYGHYLHALGPAALGDQRLAATIMWVGCLPAFAIPAASARWPRRVRRARGAAFPIGSGAGGDPAPASALRFRAQ